MAETRVALVTGAAQGIGEAIAMRLADDGLDIAVNDLPQKRDQLETVVEAIRAKGRRAYAVTGDVSDEDSVVAMIKTTVEELGGLDVMVANAGIAFFATIVDTPVEEWEKVMSINARSVMLAVKHAARQMIEQGRGGRIIAASSIAGKQGMPNVGVYAASKFAVRGLVQTAAVELRAHNITVNGYCPGLILTEMARSNLDEDDINGGPGAVAAKRVGGSPPGIKPAPPEVVASYVSYIAKPESYYITGQSVNVSGGWLMD
ncbi:NAD-P-binding protein [Cubamyces sp. BRFM 1775]|nr:NAD-P-binding protein [Cubamyces sp. BRFM 1775]